MREPEIRRIAEFDTQLLASLNRESNRGIALVAAAMLDEALLVLLVRSVLNTLGDDQSRIDVRTTLFEDRGPLQTFSAKIDMAYVSGALDEADWKALHMVRNIRNDFAHSVSLDFSNQSIQARIRNLRELLFPRMELKKEGKLLNKLGFLVHQIAEAEAAKGTRDLFDLCVSSLHDRIVQRVEDSKFQPEPWTPTVYDRLNRRAS